MANEYQIRFVDAAAMADMLDVKAKSVRIWAKQGKIPKIILPNGRFAFNPQAVFETLSKQETIALNKGDNNDR